MSTRSPCLEAALRYAARGWHVFPIAVPEPGNPKSGKRPHPIVPRGKDDATTDPERIQDWWRRAPDAGVGVATLPSGLVVFDVDVGINTDGTRKRGAESLRELERRGAGLDVATLTAITGGGGLHAFFRGDPEIVSSRIDLLGGESGLDLIVNGYVVLPPSPHYTGGAYRWSEDRPIAPLPQGLRELATAPRKSPAEKVQPDQIGQDKIGEGGRNAAMFRLGCSLRDTGIADKALRAAMHFENQRRFDPPLPDEELAELADKIIRRVQPTRDVALGAVVEQLAVEAFPPPAARERSAWIRDVAREPAPPARFYATGFSGLDDLLGGGLCTGQVCGVIGPPSVGKSAFVGSIVDHVQHSLPVLDCSTELDRKEIVDRHAARRGGLVWRDVMKGAISAEKRRELVRDMRVRVFGQGDLDRKRGIESILDELKRTADIVGEPPLLVVDYVQMLVREAGDAVRHRVGEITMLMRRASQEHDCPVLAVFSTARQFYEGNKREELRRLEDPSAYLSAAKESGDIEFDCATVLYLDVDLAAQGLPKPARIAVARCRVGEIGFVGARAQLDVGKWWGDPTAAAEMTDAAKDAEKKVGRLQREEERLLELVQRMPNRQWAELRRAFGGQGRNADAVRDRVLHDGRLETFEHSTHSRDLKPIKQVLYRVAGANNAPPPSVLGG